TIAGTKLAPALKNLRVYYVTLGKMLIIPAFSVLIYWLIPAPSILRIIQILAIACPVAAACPMLALLCDKDEGFCSQNFAVTTLVSIVSIPLIFIMAKALGI
ncbi:MAG: AEC family transporter, partial [Clostridia bacterium]|nr:AEC family transporter [Clostridia bacterium]